MCDAMEMRQVFFLGVMFISPLSTPQLLPK
jgi:hypothetical protein